MYEKLCDFQNLYKAHRAARLGKRNTGEVITFEMNLSENLINLKQQLEDGTYNISGYYEFMVHDPKDRVIHALHYRDRIVQHALCDEILAPVLDKKLIYDNAACRKEKGTDFALNRTTGFMRKIYRTYGGDAWALRFDIRKYFDNIDHETLKCRLKKIFTEERLLNLLYGIIDSYHTAPGKGLPLGNQTSQWFAILYLDPLDRLIKEKLGIKYYSRYMDDGVLIHHDREYLKLCLKAMKDLIENDLKLEFNQKTQIMPLKNGVNYLGWHLYLTDTGKVVRKLKNQSKKRMINNIKQLRYDYSKGEIDIEHVKQVMTSYSGHLRHGHTYRLRNKILCGATFTGSSRGETDMG